MDDFYECHQTYNFKLFRKAFTPASPSDDESLQINFSFFFELNFSSWVPNHDSTSLIRLMRRDERHKFEKKAHVTVQDSLSYDEIADAVEDSVACMPLWGNDLEQLIQLAWKEASESVYQNPVFGVLELDFRLIMHHRHVLLPTGGSRDQCNCMVPAAESCLGLLKKYEVDVCGNNITESCCCICFEDFSGEVLVMPCLHYFHGDCIKKWLRTSHYCPLCRYEMPIAP